MKRFAFLFGNTDELRGVKKDITRFRSFLESNIGGAWASNEICDACNLSLTDVRTYVEKIRKAEYDYVIVYFSGHGGMKRSTSLEINPNGERILEESLRGLAKRQLLVYDCCRCYMPDGVDTEIAFFDEAIESYMARRELSRKHYEDLILSSPEQEIHLYACQPGHYAYDTSGGGVYTQRLIDRAIKYSANGDVDCATVHKATVLSMRIDCLAGKIYEQLPDIRVYNSCLNKQGLVFAIKEVS